MAPDAAESGFPELDSAMLDQEKKERERERNASMARFIRLPGEKHGTAEKRGRTLESKSEKIALFSPYSLSRHARPIPSSVPEPPSSMTSSDQDGPGSDGPGSSKAPSQSAANMFPPPGLPGALSSLVLVFFLRWDRLGWGAVA
jgi:hypothetical protein